MYMRIRQNTCIWWGRVCVCVTVRKAVCIQAVRVIVLCSGLRFASGSSTTPRGTAWMCDKGQGCGVLYPLPGWLRFCGGPTGRGPRPDYRNTSLIRPRDCNSPRHGGRTRHYPGLSGHRVGWSCPDSSTSGRQALVPEVHGEGLAGLQALHKVRATLPSGDPAAYNYGHSFR